MSNPQPQVSQPGDAFVGASPELLREIIRQAELRLQAQLQSALAADARAGVLASLQAAAAAALVVFGASGQASGTSQAAAYFAAGVAMMGAMLAGIAARPIDFDFAGLKPSDWATAVQTNEPEDSGHRAYAQYLDDYLKANARRMATNGILTRWAIAAMVMAPVTALLVLTCLPRT
jgi:hypothetical protein